MLSKRPRTNLLRTLRLEKGSAVVDFVLVAPILLLTSVTVVAILLANFAQMVLLDSAGEGARFAAMADQSAGDGCRRAQELANSALGEVWKVQANCSIDDSAMPVSARVQLVATLPGLGFLPETIRVREVSVVALEVQ